jgi:hypothetical protein
MEHKVYGKGEMNMGLVISANPQDIIICKDPLRNMPFEQARQLLEKQFTNAMASRGGLYKSVYQAEYENACYQLKKWYDSLHPHPTNCNNCGAVLKTNQCEYCKSIY